MLTEFHPQSDKKVNRVYAEQASIRASNQQVLAEPLILALVIDGQAAADLFAVKSLDKARWLERLHVQHWVFAFRSISDHEGALTVLKKDFCQAQTHVLFHPVLEWQLDHPGEFFVLVAHQKLADVFVAHVCRPVDFYAQVADFFERREVVTFETRLD